MEGKWNTTLFHTNIILSIVLLCVISVMLVFTRSDVRMSYGTSDTTVISPLKAEAHNLNITIASIGSRTNRSSLVSHQI